jgi:hypothetical protein
MPYPNPFIHDLKLSFMLWLLADRTGFDFGKLPVALDALCFTLAHAYTSPETNPTAIALTDPKVQGASKKIRPLMAIGSLLIAPTMLYVVELVTRTHHADV